MTAEDKAYELVDGINKALEERTERRVKWCEWKKDDHVYSIFKYYSKK